MPDVIEEEWIRIEEFPNYHVSNFGRIWSETRDHYMVVHPNNWGNLKVTLASEWDNTRRTRSVAKLVAEAFVYNPDPVRFRAVVLLDGNPENICAANLVWRPHWFLQKYARQLREAQPRHFKNLPIVDSNGVQYDCVIQAGMTVGMLFHDIWMSCHDGVAYCPNTLTFEIDHERANRV